MRMVRSNLVWSIVGASLLVGVTLGQADPPKPNVIVAVAVEGKGPDEAEKLYMIFAPGEQPMLPEGKTDDTRFNEAGARAVADLAGQELKRFNLPVTDALVAGQAGRSR